MRKRNRWITTDWKIHRVIAISVLVLIAILSPSIVSCFDSISPGETSNLPSFGNGKVQVRIYTDYFCGPCSRMEPKIEKLLLDLVKKNFITLTLVDTPVHSGTRLYAKYFLYILNVKRSIDYVLQTRAILFEAANSKVEGQNKLEEFLRIKSVQFKPFDPASTFMALNALIDEDTIKSTPTCVIIKEGKKSAYTGEIDITNALQSLK